MPISPKKSKMARVGAGNLPEGMVSKARELRELSTGALQAQGLPMKGALDSSVPSSPTKNHRARDMSLEDVYGENHVHARAIPAIRSADEKKEILGGMLGNVDALVAGVRKAGVWGLG